MTFDLTAVIVAFITVVGGGGMLGWAALRKSGKEADKYSAEATSTIVGASADVVKLLRDEMAEQSVHQAATDERLAALERAVTAWDGWADRVLDLLDRAFGMLSDEQKATLLPDVNHARESRPPQMHRHYHDKTRGRRPHDPQEG